MKHIILAIDTSDSETTHVALSFDGKRFEKTSQSKILKSQTVLPLIEELLRDAHVSLSDISEITFHTGPGSFTGLRVGAAIANALGLLLDVPVNGKHGQVSPSY